jgi:hypothetical protein
VTKLIIWTHPVTGALHVTAPSEGTRLAWSVTKPGKDPYLASAAVTTDDGQIVGFRALDGRLSPVPVPTRAEQLAGRRTWPVPAEWEFLWAESEDQCCARVAERHVPVVTTKDVEGTPAGSVVPRSDAQRLAVPFDEIPWRVIEASELPSDRTDRDAWADANGEIIVSKERLKVVAARRAAERKARADEIRELLAQN